MATAAAAVGDVVALVLARGLGRRMRKEAGSAPLLTPEQRAAADAGLKSMMPMPGGAKPGRPFLDYVLSSLADAGFRHVAMVVGPEQEPLQRHYHGTAAPERLILSFVLQAAPLGTADAVRAAEGHVAGRPFVVVNADNLYPVATLRALRELDGPGLPVFERDELASSSRFTGERVAAFALLKVTTEGTLADIIEKPGVDVMNAAGPRALISMNCWRFDGRIFQACADVPRSPRGEFELPGAVRLAVQRGVTFRAVPARGPVLDLSRREDVAMVVAQLSGVEPQP